MKTEENLNDVIKKYLLGECTREELQYAISLFKDPKMELKIETILEMIWRKDQYLETKQHETKDLTAVLDRIHQEIKPELFEIRRRKSRRIVINFARIAAVLIIGIVTGLLFNKFNSEDSLSYSFLAPRGSISQMVLPDSTIVYLNSDSKLSYTHDGSNHYRELFLEGEAWFQVAENKKKPFVVHTGIYDVKVIGTEFNIKAYKGEKEVVTTLVKGSVIVPSTNSFKMERDKTLAPGEQLVYNREKKTISKTNVETKYYTSWKDNKLVFINMNLGDLVLLLERKYGIDINIRDKSLLTYHYDGTIKNEDVMDIMELLKVTLPIQYKVVDQTIEISKKQEGSQK